MGGGMSATAAGPGPKEARSGEQDCCVVAIGQMPPPVSGLSYITQQAITVAGAGMPGVLVKDIASRRGAAGLSKHLSRISATASACLSLVRHAKSPGRLCYVACEGGLGLLYILAVVASARLLGYRIMLHHHSFAYITRPSTMIAAILAAGGTRLVHVFLGEAMERGFRQTYAGRQVEGIVLSNAAFVPPSALGDESGDAPLVLGHLSNLTQEKGLHIFLDLLRTAVAASSPVRGILAGQAAKLEDRALIEQARQDLGDRFEYRGPLYGADKDRFYQDIDVFVFPTQYVHEAQPTVLFEALAAGCKIVSFDRGCIAEQVQQDGLVVPQDHDFSAECLAWLRLKGGTARSDRAATRVRYAALHRSARQRAEMLFAPAVDPRGAITVAATCP